MYRVSEKDISATINDFTMFCDYIDGKKPVLSKRRAALGKNDLFKINSLLYYKKEVTAPNYQQESYPFIDLIYNLALLGELFVKAADSKGNVYLTRTERKDEFDSLNVYEKYAFLLETFWTRYDIEEITRWYIGINPIDQMVQIFAASAPRDVLEKGAFPQRINYDFIFSQLSVLICYFNYFGFCNYVPIIEVGKKITKYNDSIKTVIPTEFGVNICKALKNQNIEDWNIPLLKKTLMMNEKDIVPGIPNQSKLSYTAIYANKSKKLKAEEFQKERKKAGFIPLYRFLQPIFPEGALNKTVTAVINKVVKGSFVFKVSLGGSVWRKIVLSHEHTLENLHNAVQKAFAFDNDHLYSFFMDAKRYSKHAYHSPMVDEGPFTDEVTIGELELYEGQKILYLFDYGDSWQFDVQLLKINLDEIPPKEPNIIETKGEAPRQYGNYDDDYDDDDYDDDDDDDDEK